MRYRVIITSCLDASILVAAQCTNATLAMLEEHTMDSIHPHHMMKHQIVPHWTHLLIDEVGLMPHFRPSLINFVFLRLHRVPNLNY